MFQVIYIQDGLLKREEFTALIVAEGFSKAMRLNYRVEQIMIICGSYVKTIECGLIF